MDVSDSNENGFSIERLLKNTPPQPDFVIDGIHFGRGCQYECTEYKTTGVTCWRIVGDKLEKLQENCREFFDDETYVVCRNYKVNNTHSDHLYFYWKGHRAPKGLSPLPKELEADNPPVERICQWSEPTPFLQLFQGKFVVHNKKFVQNKPRLYVLRGEVEDEAHLYEVAPETASLRSRTSFLIRKGQNITVWYGRRCPQQSRLVIRNFVGEKHLFREVEEDICEQEDLLGIKKRVIVSDKKTSLEKTPRLFYCNTITGSFLASEIECPHRSSFVTPFPFSQEHLYSAPQPAIFLLVDELDLWIWQGCNIASEDLSNKSYEGELKQLLKAVSEYNKKENVYLVYGGVEPVEFTNLFPFWEEKNEVTEVQLKNDKKLGEKVIISEGAALNN